jgi:aminopeptidase N
MISKYGVVEPEDLWSVLQDALDESAVPEDKFSIQEMMDTWIGQKGYPLVTVTRDQRTGKTTFAQEHFRLHERFGKHHENTSEVNARWWIPINFATRSNPDFTSNLTTAWLSPEVDELVMTNNIAPQDWIIVNVQHMGRAGSEEAIVHVSELVESSHCHIVDQLQLQASIA